ncbi:MAG: cell division protein FtsB [Legionellales bacterium]|nr:MAG: cell division protein FtsB [Legionellales bacterium]
MGKTIVIILGILLLLLQLRIWFGEGNLATWLRLKVQVGKKTTELHELQQRNDLLYQDITFYKEDLATMEGPARYELGMIKKGETFYHVVETVQ